VGVNDRGLQAHLGIGKHQVKYDRLG